MLKYIYHLYYVLLICKELGQHSLYIEWATGWMVHDLD